MKYIYFDTSTYNHIFKHPQKETLIANLKKFCKENDYEILLSALNFEEFAHTQDHTIREALFDIAYEICKHILLPHQKVFLKKELIALSNNEKLNFEDVFSQKGFEIPFKSVKDRKSYNQISDAQFKEWKDKKKGFLNHNKIVQKTFGDLWNSDRNMTYEEFRKHFYDNEATKEFVETIIAISLNNVDLSNYPKVNLFLNEMPGLFALTEYFCALVYQQQIKQIKPKHGDGIDMNHSVYFYYVSLFVTADQDFFDMLDLMKKPNDKPMLFEDFVATHKLDLI